MTEIIDAPGRIANLDALFGDPLDERNPVGQAAVLAADERGELPAAGERLLDGFGLNAEFVPRHLGGRFEAADRMARVLRAVFRRDCTLGLGYGITNFVAAVPVWTAGSDEQCRRVADLLLRNRRVSAGYTELAHGNDFTRNELSAVRSGESLVLNGRKELVNNVVRADALVLFARTDDAPGSRAHSHLLVDLTALPDRAVRQLPRFATAGVRGCLLGGIEFTDCPVPADALIGPPGAAMETVLQAFQVTRAVLPSVTIGILDTQLRTALRFVRRRRLYDRTVADLPHARTVLVNAFLDLLAADAMATVVARSLHLLPAETSTSTAAVKYLVPKLLQEAGYDLSVLVGARSFVRDGPEAIFQKNIRDLQVVTFAHANAAVCQATIIPQLPRMAARSWFQAEPPPESLFRPDLALPALQFDRLEVTARGSDRLSATLVASCEQLSADPVLGPLCRTLVAELRDLAAECRDLAPRNRTMVADRRSFVAAQRYATLLAAASTLGIWRNADDPFLADPAWITGVLQRLCARLGRDPGPVPTGLTERLLGQLLARADRGLTFDLAASPGAEGRPDQAR
jgi:alkylation response protein AidB-like acyl-CoA dehydrogenase